MNASNLTAETTKTALAVEVAVLKAQKAELLAALRAAIRETAGGPWLSNDTLEAARAALGKAEGGAE